MSVLVLGALHWDVVVDGPRLPRLDETLIGSAVDYRFGGKGGNQAVAAARAGARVAFAGRIGADAAGAAMADVLEREGIDTRGLQRGRGASGMSVAIVVEGGSYGAVVVSAANREIVAEEVGIPEDCRLLLIQNEIPAETNLAVARRAREAGVAVVLNAAPALAVDPGLLAMVDVLVVNRVEGADLCGLAEGAADPADLVGRLGRLCPGADIVLTLGGEGAAFAVPGGAVSVMPAERVEVVSTHGAGDAFLGAFCAAKLEGLDLAGQVRAGQRAAARRVAGC